MIQSVVKNSRQKYKFLPSSEDIFQENLKGKRDIESITRNYESQLYIHAVSTEQNPHAWPWQ